MRDCIKNILSKLAEFSNLEIRDRAKYVERRHASQIWSSLMRWFETGIPCTLTDTEGDLCRLLQEAGNTQYTEPHEYDNFPRKYGRGISKFQLLKWRRIWAVAAYIGVTFNLSSVKAVSWDKSRMISV